MHTFVRNAVACVILLSAGACSQKAVTLSTDVPQDTVETAGGEGVVPPELIPDLPEEVRVPCTSHADCGALTVRAGACHMALCDQTAGICYVGTMKDGAPCDDEDSCTEATICLAGTCGGGEPTTCNDGNPCTLDGCDPTSGCAFVPLDGPGEACNDGNPCTTADHCVKGACQGDASGCGCTTDEECAALDDADACNGHLVCTEGTCATADGSAVTCPPAAGPCVESECDPKTGTCLELPLPDGLECQDKDPCTVGDSCKQGSCQPGPTNVCAECTGDQDCQDLTSPDKCLASPICLKGHCTLDPAKQETCPQTPCVSSTCVPATGECQDVVHADGTWCSDSDACTGPDKCKAGKCQGKLLPCDDNNSCTKDVCSPATGCQFTNLSDIPCESSSPCTKESWCKNGKCVATAPIDCQDDDPCTEDFCDPEKGCDHKPITGVPCDDANACTQGDACFEGTCEAGPNVCDCKTDLDCADYEDGNLCNGTLVCADFACSVDPATVVTCKTDGDTDCKYTTCNPLTGTCGKLEAPYGSACNDGNSCTVGETCFYGECLGGIELPCDDGNPCTNDSCSPAQGCVHEPVGQGACDDQDGCTEGDFCKSGICVGGKNICVCKGDFDCAKFEDGDPCNGTLACVNSVCVIKAGSVVVCPAPNSPCQVISCSKQTGGCETANLPSGSPCSDADSCTTKDACYDGVCKGEETLCSDADPCTLDSCKPESGCVHEPTSEVPCDDGNSCTAGDTCDGGKCIPGTNECNCQTDAECNVGDDDKCDGSKICLQGKCVLDAKTVVKCDSSLDTPCAKNLCNPETGKCGLTQTPDGTVCDDKLFCSKDDVCQQGKCLGLKLDCSDGNPCTDDVCVESQQGCIHLNNSLPCDDTSLCTKNDACKAGTCTGDPISCDDSNVCTKDSCAAATGCQHAPSDGACDDGNLCTTNDACSGGTCTGVPLQCDDGNPCTTDTCSPATGCKYQNNSLACEDANPCTVKDICQGGQCVPGTPKDCNDKNPCTADTCDPTKGGCVQTSLSDVPCDDANPCTLSDSCKAGVCSPGATDPCDDKNPCTKDGCSTAAGCYHDPLNSGTCTDGDACTTGDKCTNGKCGGTALACNDNNVCTKDLCDPASGCIFPPVPDNPTTACDDGSKCTTGDVCAGGKCLPGSTKACADTNPCTDDSCNAATGECVFANNTAPCNDSSVCTQTDKCSGGVCVGSSPLTCNDNTPCTTDSCDPIKGCQYTWNGTCQCSTNSDCKDDGNLCNGIPQCIDSKCVVPPGSIVTCPPNGDTACKKNKCVPATGQCVLTPEPTGTPCSDGSVCTSDDKCTATSICLGTPIVCEDNNSCTDNKCDAATGCYFPLKSGACDDGNPCTVNDSCITGSCQGKAYDCNDSNGCTQDVCVPSNGLPTCSHPPQSGACNDSNQCTAGDACVNGVCTGSPLVCSDGNVCTEDSCDPAVGCVFAPSADGTACSDGNLCTTPDTCKSGVCNAGPWAIACCLGAKDCEDNYPCTTETCSANQCIYTLKNCAQNNGCLAGYCNSTGVCASDPAQSPVTLASQGFEGANSPGWLFGINTGGSPDIFWSVSDKRSFAGKYSLYVGNPKDYTYDHGVGNAVALSPPVALPAGKEASLKFAFHSLVKEAGCTFDYLLVQVHDPSGGVTTLAVLCDPTSAFELKEYDLKTWAGQTVRIGFVFQTVDNVLNDGEGLYIDDFAVVTKPVAGCCTVDGHCDDDNLCSADICSAYQCTYPSISGTFFQEDFESGSIVVTDTSSKLEYWYLTSTNGDISWTVDDFKAFSTPFSLYAGNAKTHTYNFGAATTRIRTPRIPLPADSTPVVKFRMWLGLADTSCSDYFRVGTTTVYGGAITWHSTFCTPSAGGFEDVAIDLPPSVAAAKQVFVHLQFVSDAANNNAQGVFIDNFRVEQKGAGSCCKESSECDDKSDCTVDACEGTEKGGLCFNHKVINWLENFDDGSAQSWTYESTNPSVSWSATTYRAFSSKYSLYCGRPTDHAYMDMLGGVVRTTTPELTIEDVPTLTPQLLYQRYMHLYNSAAHCFTVEVLEKGGLGGIQVVESSCGDKLGLPKWMSNSISLTAYKGKTITVRFTLTFAGHPLPPNPGPEGVYIDDVRVGYSACN